MIDINHADAELLANLPGIGPATARAIIDYRTENGPFRCIEDIMKVSGIKESRFAKIKDMIRVG
jgi:competence protein ComEA